MHGIKEMITLGQKIEGQRFEEKSSQSLGTDGAFVRLCCVQFLSYSEGRKSRCASSDSARVHIIFSLPGTSINNYTNNVVLIGVGESHGQISGPTAKSMA